MGSFLELKLAKMERWDSAWSTEDGTIKEIASVQKELQELGRRVSKKIDLHRGCAAEFNVLFERKDVVIVHTKAILEQECSNENAQLKLLECDNGKLLELIRKTEKLFSLALKLQKGGEDFRKKDPLGLNDGVEALQKERGEYKEKQEELRKEVLPSEEQFTSATREMDEGGLEKAAALSADFLKRELTVTFVDDTVKKIQDCEEGLFSLLSKWGAIDGSLTNGDSFESSDDESNTEL